MNSLTITIKDLPEDEMKIFWDTFVSETAKSALGLKISPVETIELSYPELGEHPQTEELLANLIGHGIALYVAAIVQAKLKS